MHSKINILVFVLTLAASPIYAKSSFDCTFEKHYAVYLSEDRTERYNNKSTILSFVENETTKDTLNLDGSVRATNSTKWTPVDSNNLGASYIGSGGDLLTIMYKPEDGSGTYQAVIQWAGIGYAFSSVGICTGKP